MAAAIRLLSLVSAAALVSAGIYPDGHFDHVTKLSALNFENAVKLNVDAGKTMFVRWIASEG
jgi:hypothetical protein